MEVIKLDEAEIGQNKDKCKTLEYSFGDKDIDLGIATITGRFPDKGYAMNEVSKELIYVIEGKCTIYIENEIVNLAVGDSILINPKELYYWETDYCKVSMACTPAWSPSQHKIIEK